MHSNKQQKALLSKAKNQGDNNEATWRGSWRDDDKYKDGPKNLFFLS